jgi:transposase InsO family protein/transposase-like protein
MILEEYEKTRSIKAICSKYKIHKSSLLRWKSNNATVATSQCGTVYTAAQLYNMKRELETPRQENEIIRVCHCSATASTEEKVKEVQRLKDRFTVYALCQVLDLSRATFYRVSLRQKNKTRYEENDDALKIVIEEEFINSGERFGASMIKVKLNERGFRVSKSHIQRLMRELNLICKQNRARCFNSTHRKYKYRRNRLQRNFTQDSPNKFWVSDITYARVNDEFYAICVIIDLFSRKVLAYGIAPEMKTTLVKSTFLKAFESRNQPVGLTFHSDQGTQYTAFEFRKLLRELGVRQSLSNPGTPHDNAVAEAFFSILKREELSHNWYNTPEDLENTLQEYIDFFNRKRPHRKLKLQTPDQFEENYLISLASNC